MGLVLELKIKVKVKLWEVLLFSDTRAPL